MTKKELVAKIAKEQSLDPIKLNRLNMDQLKKMDLVVEDEDLLGSSDGTIVAAEVSPEVIAVSLPELPTGQEVEGSDGQISIQDPPVSLKVPVLIGYHPVTGNPVYQ